jgi:hypothetical protein
MQKNTNQKYMELEAIKNYIRVSDRVASSGQPEEA